MPSKKPKITIVFGRMGSGKSEAAKILAQMIGQEFYEGDNDVPKSMREKVTKFEIPVIEEINELTKNIIAGIKHKLSQNTPVVVSQALYLNQHRLQILEAFKDYDIEFVYIATPIQKQYQQLKSRDSGEKWVDYAKLNDSHFQEPDPLLHAHVIRNTGSIDQLKAQLKALPFMTQPSVLAKKSFLSAKATVKIVTKEQTNLRCCCF